MDRTSGRHEIVVGLLDGPVAVDHPELAKDSIRALPAAHVRFTGPRLLVHRIWPPLLDLVM
jgi:hypothetical protein